MKKNNWLSKMLRRATLVCRAARNMKMVRFPQKRVRWEGQTFGGNDKNVTHLPPLEPKNNRDRKINRVISQKFQCSIVLTTGQLNNSGAKNKPKRKQTKTRNRTVVSGLICHLKKANFLAVENKVLILSGVTTRTSLDVILNCVTLTHEANSVAQIDTMRVLYHSTFFPSDAFVTFARS